MKQAQSYRSRPRPGAFRPSHSAGAWSGARRAEIPARGVSGSVTAAIGFLFGMAWSIVTFPFRLVFGVMSLLGRLTGVIVGFALMVVGMALGAGPFYLIGIPIFLVGLLLTLRCLG